MGAVVVALVAAVILLVAGVVVVAGRLIAALRQLRDAVEHTNERIQPVIGELNDAGQIATVELAALQANVQALTASDAPGPPSRPSSR